MPRYIKRASTKEDILRKMFEEIKAVQGGNYEEIGGVAVSKIQSFDEINPAYYDDLIYKYLQIKIVWEQTCQSYVDLCDVDFDFENCERDTEVSVPSKLPDGTEFIWAWAGGDWEAPVSFILFIDPKDRVRAYIPTDGNIFCKDCRAAYGSCHCEEEHDIDDDDAEPDYQQMYDDVCKHLCTK